MDRQTNRQTDRQTDRDRTELLTKWASRTHAVIGGLSSRLLSHAIRPIRFELVLSRVTGIGQSRFCCCCCKLQLNDNKTEAMIILSNRMCVHRLSSVIHIGDADVPFVSSVKNLGITLDSNLSMSQHISNTCKAAYIQIRQKFHTTPSHHSSNPNPRMLSCPLSLRLL